VHGIAHAHSGTLPATARLGPEKLRLWYNLEVFYLRKYKAG
jgi:hypothetical protein